VDAARTAASEFKIGGSPISHLLKRPNFGPADLPEELRTIAPPEIWALLEADVKYEGYANRQAEQNRVVARRSEQRIPDGLDFGSVAGLRAETRQRLGAIRPTSLGQAARISGITPADISILSIWLSKNDLQSKTPEPVPAQK
jgi:tRNA uridine 5-carboxymethylaminomethyl modification enzyme